ncbi:hypothetical protein [Cupriavidus agavae]|uniref:hypothetical protein n=1 Tax=Cupriavidus agavae TaxID=1001822 RepID=UPI00102C52ED|nr:hypothetical protein [Cupriavidus agavae]
MPHQDESRTVESLAPDSVSLRSQLAAWICAIDTEGDNLAVRHAADAALEIQPAASPGLRYVDSAMKHARGTDGKGARTLPSQKRVKLAFIGELGNYRLVWGLLEERKGKPKLSDAGIRGLGRPICHVRRSR